MTSHPVYKQLRTTLCIGLSALFAQGCSGDCITLGCLSGLIVQLAALPQGAYKAELLVNGVVQGTSVEANCGETTGCAADLHFSTMATDQVAVRVTTPAGTRLTEFPRLTYSKNYPNGKDCPPVCLNARVVAALP